MRSGSRRCHRRRFHDPPVETQLREKPLQLIIADTARASEINYTNPITTFCGNGDGCHALQHGKREFRQLTPPETIGSEINQIDYGLILIIAPRCFKNLRPGIKKAGLDFFTAQVTQQQRRNQIPEQWTKRRPDFSRNWHFFPFGGFFTERYQSGDVLLSNIKHLGDFSIIKYLFQK